MHVSAASVLLARICETRGVSPMAPGSSTDPRALPIALEGPSTSSTAPTLGSGAATMRAEQPTDLMVTAVAMKGMVAADRTASGDTVLTHMHTFERHVLRGEWSLVVQENSPNVFVAKDGSVACDEYHDVEDLFARQLFQDENGERYLVRIRDGAPDWQPMATLMSRHRRARMTMHIDNTSASLAFDVYVFNRPRLASARVFWPLTTLYGFIGHKSFDHAPAHWMSKSWARWAARLTSACGSSQLVVGTYVVADRPRKTNMPFEDRCLSKPSVSTFGLFYLLTMMTACKPRHGGLRDAQARMGCATFLRSVWSWATSYGAWALRVQASQEWTARWPRPEAPPGAEGWADLQVLGGRCSLAPLRALENDWEHGACAKTWISTLAAVLDVDSDNIPLDSLARAAMQSPTTCPLAAQVLWCSAMMLEKLVGAQSQRSIDDVGTVGCLSLEWHDVADLPLSGAPMERYLARYVEESVRVSRRHTVVGLVTDKTNLPGVALQNTCLILPSSRAIVCCPAVRWGCL